MAGRIKLLPATGWRAAARATHRQGGETTFGRGSRVRASSTFRQKRARGADGAALIAGSESDQSTIQD